MDRWRALHTALAAAPKPPRWPITPYARWYYRDRWKVIHGTPDARYLQLEAALAQEPRLAEFAEERELPRWTDS